MLYKTTIFDGAITNENSFTELFKNFLRYKPFRQSFLNLINFPFDRDNIDYDCFDTQFTISKFGRPDLVLASSNLEILFEIKVHNTSLTANQPLAYYEYLKNKSTAKNRALVLIAPSNYYDWDNYTNLVKGIKAVDDNVHTQEIHWNNIINIVTELELAEISPLFKEYSIFLANWLHTSVTYFDSLNTSTMFGKQFPESLNKTCTIIDNACNEFKNRGFSVKRLNDKYFAEYGFLFNLPNEETLFFEIWFDYWLSTGNPICIGLDSEDPTQVATFKALIETSNLPPVSKFEDYPITFIDQTKFMDKNCEQLITNILLDFATKLNALTVEQNNLETLSEE